MNVIVVPFFLAANLAVNDVSDWKFGPEYTFNVSLTYDMDILGTMNLNSTIQCRPRDPEILLCRLNNIWGEVDIMGRKMTEDIDSDRTFGIKFNERGVEAVLEQSPGDIRILNIIRKIANQFSMNVDLIRRSNVRPTVQFMDREKTSMGDCVTTYVIEREEHQPNAIRRNDGRFRLEVLPMPTVKPDEIHLSIGKNMRECTDEPEKIYFLTDEFFKMETFNSTICIDDTYRTLTEINGHLMSSKQATKSILFKETIKLNLDTIKPAQGKLPPFDGEIIVLNTKFIPE